MRLEFTEPLNPHGLDYLIIDSCGPKGSVIEEGHKRIIHDVSDGAVYSQMGMREAAKTIDRIAQEFLDYIIPFLEFGGVSVLPPKIRAEQKEGKKSLKRDKSRTGIKNRYVRDKFKKLMDIVVKYTNKINERAGPGEAVDLTPFVARELTEIYRKRLPDGFYPLSWPDREVLDYAFGHVEANDGYNDVGLWSFDKAVLAAVIRAQRRPSTQRLASKIKLLAPQPLVAYVRHRV